MYNTFRGYAGTIQGGHFWATLPAYDFLSFTKVEVEFFGVIYDKRKIFSVFFKLFRLYFYVSIKF